MKGPTPVPWLALGILVVVGAGLGARAFLPRILPCPFKTLFGIPCLTCGLTRCCSALAEGRWAEAFHWHSGAVAALALSPLVIVWDCARAWRRRPYRALPESNVARWLTLALVLGTWAVQVVRGV